MIESIKTDISVTVNDVPVAGVVSVESIETNNDKCAREFLGNKRYALIRKAASYLIKLEYYAAEPPTYTDGFTLEIERDGITESFLGCMVKSKSIVCKNGVKTVRLTIESEEKE